MKSYYSFFLGIALLIGCQVSQPTTNPLSKWDQITKSTEKYSGFMNYYHDTEKGKIYLEISPSNKELLYVNYLSAGIGSNDIGLDRGKIGDTKVISFKRIGSKMMMFQPNYNFRASTDNAMEQKAVEDAFAYAIIHGFDIVAEQDWSVLVDATDFFLHDRFGVGKILSDQKEGTYSFDLSRSALNADGSRNFPENTELDFWISLKGKATGRELRTVSPDTEYLTVRQHHSFVQLPDNEYEARKFDVRGGYFGTSYSDYSAPIDQDITKRFITRHRLKKVDPEAAMSEVVEPIIYYLDPGTPEPIRSALMEGAQWWDQAFEAAGFKNAFQVKVLPDDADPLDIRYNVIQWVHRSTRGWSYGMSVVDPRTGEIIKGHVSLGSLRVRQDFLIATGLLSPFNGEEDPRMLEMSLARLRQLAAHEVGHTIGLAHNYISSTENDASVMDYPHPNIRLDAQGEIDLSKAYGTNIGEWDKVAIRYGYSEFLEGANVEALLDQIVTKAYADGLRFISDRDARDPGGSHAYAHLWDNGQNAAKQLAELMKVRKVAISQMDEAVIPHGTPLAKIQDVLVPIYFLHRYQLEAAVKMIGGMDYNYKVRGDNQAYMNILSAELQMEAVNNIIATVKPEVLALPEDLLNLIHPRPIAYYDGRELLKNRTGVSFDAIGAAEQLATATFGLLLHPARLARLIEFNARDAQYPGVEAVLNTFTNSLYEAPHNDAYLNSIQQAVQFRYLQALIQASKQSSQSPMAISAVNDQLRNIQTLLYQKTFRNNNTNSAFATYQQKQIELFMSKPHEYHVKEAYDLPPGSPIGQSCEW
ncbi:MAG: hypothetical protein ACI9L9_001033 [Marivirga sp.]|jgi:hypothetical protein